MNAVAKSQSFSVIKQTLTAFWEERNQRERTMLLVASAAIVIGLFYMLLIDPALSGRRDVERRLPTLRQQSAELQALAKDATGLSAKASAPVAPMSKESLETSLAGKGLKPQNVTVTGEMAKVQLAGVSFSNLVDWFDEMQRTMRVSVVDATIEPQAQPDTVNATFTVRQQKGAQSQ